MQGRRKSLRTEAGRVWCTFGPECSQGPFDHRVWAQYHEIRDHGIPHWDWNPMCMLPIEIWTRVLQTQKMSSPWDVDAFLSAPAACSARHPLATEARRLAKKSIADMNQTMKKWTTVKNLTETLLNFDMDVLGSVRKFMEATISYLPDDLCFCYDHDNHQEIFHEECSDPQSGHDCTWFVLAEDCTSEWDYFCERCDQEEDWPDRSAEVNVFCAEAPFRGQEDMGTNVAEFSFSTGSCSHKTFSKPSVQVHINQAHHRDYEALKFDCIGGTIECFWTELLKRGWFIGGVYAYSPYQGKYEAVYESSPLAKESAAV